MNAAGADNSPEVQEVVVVQPFHGGAPNIAFLDGMLSKSYRLHANFALLWNKAQA
jgi:prepilin-type processing-associated H-X9-DG protein